VICSNSNYTCGSLEVAHDEDIKDVYVLNYQGYGGKIVYSNALWKFLDEDIIPSNSIDLIVFAGFIKEIYIPDKYKNKVINKYNSLVKNIVDYTDNSQWNSTALQNNCISRNAKIAGVTVHYVDESNFFNFNPKKVIAQFPIEILPNDDAETLEEKIQRLSMDVYPRVIEWIALKQLNKL
jgi:folate-dependent phosphoribosylglycinamide formyltransferase PurN